MLFDRIVCGVDGSPRSLAALDHALRLVAPGGRLVAVTVRHLPSALLVSGNGARGVETVAAEALEAHAHAAQVVTHIPEAEARLLDGDPATCLLAVAEQEGARLLVVGARPHRRPAGVLLGRVDTTILHQAPCPVLVARVPWEPGRPRRIAVGVDGSSSSLLALDVSRRLAARLRADLHPIAAAGRDPTPAADALSSVVHDPRNAVDALVAASEEADLLVVGSRGLRGLAALGSVSERVAHAAACSVLVVRPATARGAAPAAGRLALALR